MFLGPPTFPLALPPYLLSILLLERSFNEACFRAENWFPIVCSGDFATTNRCGTKPLPVCIGIHSSAILGNDPGTKPGYSIVFPEAYRKKHVNYFDANLVL